VVSVGEAGTILILVGLQTRNWLLLAVSPCLSQIWRGLLLRGEARTRGTTSMQAITNNLSPTAQMDKHAIDSVVAQIWRQVARSGCEPFTPAAAPVAAISPNRVEDGQKSTLVCVAEHGGSNSHQEWRSGPEFAGRRVCARSTTTPLFGGDYRTNFVTQTTASNRRIRPFSTDKDV
jgi:hypothetical protein